MITDHSQRLTTGRWEQAVNRAQERVNMLPREDKLTIALHDFATVTAEDFVPFDYCDGPNGVRGHGARQRFHYDDQFRSRVVRAGTYEIQLGVSSLDLRLKAAVQVP